MTTQAHNQQAVGYERYQHLIVGLQENGVAVVTFNRPQVLNAVNVAMHTELRDIFFDLERDPAVRVIVVTGAGRAFMAAGDWELLDAALSGLPRATYLMKEARDMVWNIIQCEKPIIAAVNGDAIGMGCHIALLSDFILASENARFCDGHARAGIAAGDGGVLIWPLLIGMARAKRYLLTGEFIGAVEAERIGLITQVVPPDSLMTEALKLANRLAAGPLRSVMWTKSSVNQWLRLFATVSFDHSAVMELISLQGAEGREGIAALKERRKPQYPRDV